MNALLDSGAAVTGWMLFSLVIGGVVVVAALAAHDAQHAANRAVRWVWMAAIGVIVALSLIAPLRRAKEPMRVAVSVPATDAGVSYPRMPQGNALVTGFQRVRDAVVGPLGITMHRAEQRWSRLPAPIHRALLAGWLLSASAALGALFLSYVRIRRRVRRWPLQEVAGVRARIAPMAGPAVVGLAPAEIVLPAWLLDRTDAEQRLVVAHETEHVRAGDPWLLVIACAAVACMPWHPALWFAFGRLRLAVELDCDRRVLQRGVRTADYGSLLIDLSARRRTLPSAMPAFSCNGSYLERRLVAMTSRRARFAMARRIGGLLLATVALATACESKLPTSAEVEEMDVAAAEKQVSRLVVMDTASTRYIVDGKEVSKEAAKEIPAGDIATVAVSREGTAMNEVRIYRRKAPMTAADSGVVREEPVTVTGFRMKARDTSGVVGVVVRPAGEMKRMFDGLLIVDGKMAESTDLQRLDPALIASIEVIKGNAAAKAYSDPRAANGVIKVTTKAGKP